LVDFWHPKKKISKNPKKSKKIEKSQFAKKFGLFSEAVNKKKKFLRKCHFFSKIKKKEIFS